MGPTKFRRKHKSYEVEHTVWVDVTGLGSVNGGNRLLYYRNPVSGVKDCHYYPDSRYEYVDDNYIIDKVLKKYQ